MSLKNIDATTAKIALKQVFNTYFKISLKPHTFASAMTSRSR
jgi:hypothetical protein